MQSLCSTFDLQQRTNTAQAVLLFLSYCFYYRNSSPFRLTFSRTQKMWYANMYREIIRGNCKPLLSLHVYLSVAPFLSFCLLS